MEKQLTAAEKAEMLLENYIRNYNSYSSLINQLHFTKREKDLFVKMMIEFSETPTESATEKELKDKIEGILVNVCIDYTHRWSKDIQNPLHKTMDDYIEELKCLISPVSQTTEMKELRDKFFNECCKEHTEELGVNFVNISPKNVFEWFKPYISFSQTKGLDITDEEIIEKIFDEMAINLRSSKVITKPMITHFVYHILKALSQSKQETETNK